MNIKKCKIGELQYQITEHTDVFICCGSFEARCLSVSEHLNLEAIEHALIAENIDLRPYVADKTRKLLAMFNEKSIHIEISNSDPIKTADSIVESLQKLQTEQQLSYFVDITTFTHESLLILLKILTLFLKKDDTIKFVYVSAADYAPIQGAEGQLPPYADKWLSKGVADVRSVLGYPGKLLTSRKTHLIVLVGYEHERASKLIEVFEPNVLSLGHGRVKSSMSQKHYDANAHFCQLVHEATAAYTNVSDFEFSCSDPWDACNAILKEAKEPLGYNVVVAPMNTKISTVGSMLATLKDESIQLCYAQAERFNFENYSTPGDSCYIFELPELKKSI